jgi:hypothetical protein
MTRELLIVILAVAAAELARDGRAALVVRWISARLKWAEFHRRLGLAADRLIAFDHGQALTAGAADLEALAEELEGLALEMRALASRRRRSSRRFRHI